MARDIENEKKLPDYGSTWVPISNPLIRYTKADAAACEVQVASLVWVQVASSNSLLSTGLNHLGLAHNLQISDTAHRGAIDGHASSGVVAVRLTGSNQHVSGNLCAPHISGSFSSPYSRHLWFSGTFGKFWDASTMWTAATQKKYRWRIGSIYRNIVSPTTASHQCMIITGSHANLNLYKATKNNISGPASFTIAGWFKFHNDGEADHGRSLFRLSLASGADTPFIGRDGNIDFATTGLFNTGSSPDAAAVGTLTVQAGVPVTVATNLNGKKLGLTASDGTKIEYIFDTAKTLNQTANKIGLSGITTIDDISDRIIATINDTSTHAASVGNDPKIAAADASGVAGDNDAHPISLTQDDVGHRGLRTVYFDASATYLTGTNFSGPKFGALHRSQSFGVNASNKANLAVGQIANVHGNGSVSPYRFELFHASYPKRGQNFLSVNFLSKDQSSRMFVASTIPLTTSLGVVDKDKRKIDQMSVASLSNDWFHIAVTFNNQAHYDAQSASRVTPATTATTVYLNGVKLYNQRFPQEPKSTAFPQSDGMIGDFGNQPLNLIVGGPDVDRKSMSWSHIGFWRKTLSEDSITALYEARNGVTYSKKSGKLTMPPRLQMAYNEDVEWHSRLRSTTTVPDAFVEDKSAIDYQTSFSSIELDFSSLIVSGDDTTFRGMHLYITSSHPTGSRTTDKVSQFSPTRRGWTNLAKHKVIKYMSGNFANSIGTIQDDGSHINRVYMGHSATGRIKLADGLGAADNGSVLVVTAANGDRPDGRFIRGKIKRYIFTKDVNFATSDLMVASSSATVVKYVAGSTTTQIAQQLQAAINSTNGNNVNVHNSVINLHRLDNIIHLTQQVSGACGNTNIETPSLNSGLFSIASFSTGVDRERINFGVKPSDDSETTVQKFLVQLAAAINKSKAGMRATLLSSNPGKRLRLESARPGDLSDKFRVTFTNKKNRYNFPKLKGQRPATGSVVENTMINTTLSPPRISFRFSKSRIATGSFLFGVNRSIETSRTKYQPIFDRMLPDITGSGIMRSGNQSLFLSETLPKATPFNEASHPEIFGFNQLKRSTIYTSSYDAKLTNNAYHSASFGVSEGHGIRMSMDSDLFVTGTLSNRGLHRLGPSNSLRMNSQDHIVIDLPITASNHSSGSGKNWRGSSDAGTAGSSRYMYISGATNVNHNMGYYNFSAKCWKGVGRGLNAAEAEAEWKYLKNGTNQYTTDQQIQFYLDQQIKGFGQSTDNLLQNASIINGGSGFQRGLRLRDDSNNNLQTKLLVQETGLAPAINTYGFPSHGKFHLSDDETIRVKDYIGTDSFLLENVFLEFSASYEIRNWGGALPDWCKSAAASLNEIESSTFTFFLLNQRKANLNSDIENETIKAIFGTGDINTVHLDKPNDDIVQVPDTSSPYSYKVQIPTNIVTTSSISVATLTNTTKYVDSIRDLVAYTRVGFFSSDVDEQANKYHPDITQPIQQIDVPITSSIPNVKTHSGDGSDGKGLKHVTIQISGFIPLIPRSPGLGPGFSDFRTPIPQYNADPTSGSLSNENILQRYTRGSRNGLGLSTGRAPFGGEFSGIKKDYEVRTFRNIAMAIAPENMDDEVPYLLKPEDKLILGIQLPTSYMSHANFNDHLVSFNPQVMRLHFFGGPIRNNVITPTKKISEDDLFYTDAVHDVIGIDNIFDQFDTEPNFTQPGTYTDKIITGSMISDEVKSSTNISTGRKKIGNFTEIGGWVTSSFPRNVRLLSDEIYYDSLVPNFAEMFGIINANVMGLSIHDSTITGEAAAGGASPRIGISDVNLNDDANRAANTPGARSKQFVIAIHSPRIPTFSTTISGTAVTFMSPALSGANGTYFGAINKSAGAAGTVGSTPWPLHVIGGEKTAPCTYYTDAIKPGLVDNWYTCFPFEPKFLKLKRVTTPMNRDDFMMTEADFVPNIHPSGTQCNALVGGTKRTPDLLCFASPFLYPPILEHLYHIPKKFSKGKTHPSYERLYSQKMVTMTSPYTTNTAIPGGDSGITHFSSVGVITAGAAKYTSGIYSNANLKGGNLDRWNRALFGFGDIPGGIPRSLATPGFMPVMTQSAGTLTPRSAAEVTDASFHPDSIDYYRGVELRGLRYGLINYQKQPLSCVFRRDRYGQFRDMLEQRLDSRIFKNGEIEDKAPVNVVFMKRPDLESGIRSSTTPTDTNSSNLSQFATSSLPYFDGQFRDRADQEPDIRTILEVYID